MPDDKNRKTIDPGREEGFDRQAYLKNIRQDLLRNLGLPEGTKPENVTKLLEIKRLMGK